MAKLVTPLVMSWMQRSLNMNEDDNVGERFNQGGNWKLHSMLPWGTWARLSFVMASGVTLEDGLYVVGFLANDETFHQVGCMYQQGRLGT